MKQNKTIAIALAALFSSSLALAEVEVSGKLIIESAGFQNIGVSTIGNFGQSQAIGTGAQGGTCDMTNPVTGYCGVGTSATPTNTNENYKNEMGYRLYIDGDITDSSSFHVELQGQSAQSSDYSDSSSFTQRDPLREIYTDISGSGFEVRLGKQQIVWGTADGMKLLDIINPTDYAEMAQNQMEDSRVPVWALNMEKGSVQAVISQPKENVFAGLNRGIDDSVRENNMFQDDTTLNNGTDTGHAFMMMGPDTITGVHNGFLNITPDLGSVASRFSMAFDAGVADPSTGANMGLGNLAANSMMGFTVDGFEAMNMAAMSGAMGGAPGTQEENLANIPANFQGAMTNTWAALAGPTSMGGMGSEEDRNGFIGDNTGDGNYTSADLTGAQMLAFGFAPLYNTNLANITPDQDTAFDYMGNTTFRTFDTFVNAKSQYVYNMPKGGDVDIAIRTSQTTKSGVNYSLNFSNSYDKNPIIDLSWRNQDGDLLSKFEMPCPASMCGADTMSLGLTDGTNTYGGAEQQAAKDTAVAAAMAGGETDPMVLGGIGLAATNTRTATLQFEQKVVKTKNIGASFDTTVNAGNLGPVVIRGEVLYTTDGKAPVINKDLLAIGDLVGALQMVEADRFKFVLGADITVLTNMLISGQYISDRNLDFVENGDEYTADYATMHLSNEFNKSIEDKHYLSLFFSKPFGESGQHRWNNITMLEEGAEGNDAYWNRFDVDWGLSDEVQGSVEVNNYWGNTNTQFGQLKNSSNVQVGLKYSF